MKLSTRKQLLSEADQELKSIKRSINEFSPMGKIHTLLEVDLDVNKMTTNIANKYAPKDVVKNIQQGLIKIVNGISKKYGGKFTTRTSQLSNIRTLVIEWDREMEQSEFDKIYNELKNTAEKTFNTNLFEFYTGAYHFKKTGALGTSIGKDKITNWLKYDGPNFGQGGEYAQEYGQFLNGLQSKHPEFDKKEMQYKIGKVLSSYFKKNSRAVVRKTDWLSDVKPQIEKLYV